MSHAGTDESTMGRNCVGHGYQVPLFITRHYKTVQDSPLVAIEILIALVVGEIKTRYKGRKICWNRQANGKKDLK